jgi:glutamyl-tRNA synthetase
VAREDRLVPTGRFAPSPTAPLHLGNLRTALVAWLFARTDGSRFLLRVEDLDRQACRPEHEAAHRADLVALGLDWDDPVVRQSERFDRYRDVIERLDRQDLTYPCYCTRREVLEAAAAPHQHRAEGSYPGTCRDLTAAEQSAHAASGRPAALRVRAEGATEGFDDVLHGRQEGAVDDFVICRNDGTPAYNLAVVVDDADAGVRQVVRGDDLLAGTPRQVLLGHWLRFAIPRYAHVPLVLGPDRERLAKRHGAVTLADRLRAGDTAAGVRSLLATSLGLAAPGEPVGPDDLIARFDPAALPREPWVLPMMADEA